ncbi:homeodomain-like protein [Tanacetum coccineum]
MLSQALMATLLSSRWQHYFHAEGLQRSGKSYRLRWVNYLRLDMKHGNFRLTETISLSFCIERLGTRESYESPSRSSCSETSSYWFSGSDSVVLGDVEPPTSSYEVTKVFWNEPFLLDITSLLDSELSPLHILDNFVAPIAVRYEKKLVHLEQPLPPNPDPETVDPETIDAYYELVNA